MISKRGLVIFGFLFAMVFLLGVGVYAESCWTDLAGDCTASGGTIVAKLSDTTNAHASIYSDSSLQSALCCDWSASRACTSTNTVLRLYTSTNSHVAGPSNPSYSTRICYGDLSCTESTGSCPSEYPIQVASISQTSNAHIGGFNDYSTKICCRRGPLAQCGNGIPEANEGCDDGNTNSGDGCSSLCVVESGYTATASKTCVYKTYPSTPWGKILLNGQQVSFNSGGGLIEGETLIMTVDDDMCLPSGTPMMFNLKEGSNILVTPTGYVNTATNTISASYTVTKNFLQSLGTGASSIYFAVSSLVPQSSIITVTPVFCDLTSVSWANPGATVSAGQPVQINVQGTNCDGKTIIFEIWEKDALLNPDDIVTPAPASITYGSSTSTTWNVVFQDDTDGGQSNPPEYYIKAYAESTTSPIDTVQSSTSDSDMLKVTPPVSCGDGACNSGETCLTCASDCVCSGSTPVCSSSGACIAECILNSAVWSSSSVEEGTQVQLIVHGTNCDGNTVSFEIAEYDAPPGANDLVNQNPQNVVMGSGTATGVWAAEWQSEGWPESDPPEYQFTATISALGKQISSSTPRLSVTQTEIELCGNGAIDSGEDCDGTNLGGETCQSFLGSGWEGTLSCDSSCNFVTSGCTALQCSIASASWSESGVLEGDEVRLNVQVSDVCLGETANFVIKEKDSLSGDDDVLTNPSSITISSTSFYTTWDAEYQNDAFPESDPPEYYFTISIPSWGESRISSDPLLEVNEYNPFQCSEISTCGSYTTQEQCEVDLCEKGYETRIYNSDTRCMEVSTETCVWDSINGCGSNFEESVSCGVCGNGVKDSGEQCDDGNNINLDGCSSTCLIEDNINNPCLEGLTLCEDNTCSLNCDYTNEGTADCNYNGICDSGEGCTCSDCDGEIDTCEIDLRCSINDEACCDSSSDGVCTPGCAFIDSDCGGFNAVCGNGLRETGEECDDGNLDNGDGCSSVCIYEIIGPEESCPEGTTLCNDGTCSLNCYATDDGEADCRDSSCCEIGLEYSLLDGACCNSNSNGVCNPYCSYVDPDCSTDIQGEFGIGTCDYSGSAQDDCTDGFITRSLVTNWRWDSANSFLSNPDGTDYIESPFGTWRYDPVNPLTLFRKSEACISKNGVTDQIQCPAQIEVNYFGALQFIIAVMVVVLIYFIIRNRIKESGKSSGKKPVKKRRK